MRHMRQLPYIFSLFITLAVAPAFADAQSKQNWEQIDVDDGIRVWKNEVPGQELPGFRGEVTIDAPIQKVLNAIKDWKQHTKWMHRCAESIEVQHIDDNRSLMYNRTDSPWPVSDRDVLLDTIIDESPDGNTITLKFKNSTSNLKPVKEDVVRMPRLVGYYKLVKVGEGKTKVTYQVEANPGGSLPTWLVKRVTKDLPFQTLDALRARVTGKS
jgi:hypothetical protein